MSVSVRRVLLAGVLAGLCLGGGGKASAQYYGPPPYPYNAPPPYPGPPPVGNRFYGYARPIPPDAVIERLEDQGYRDIDEPRFAGSTYETVATFRGRERVRLVVDAFRGVVVEQIPLMRRNARRFTDDDAPPPAYRPRRPSAPEAVRPGAGLPPASPPPGDARPPAEARLPAPTDTRLAPGSAPSSTRPGGGEAVQGVNPDATGRPTPAARPARPAAPQPTREVRRPNTAAPATADRPAAAGQEVARPNPDRPVRVIQGVTPLNSPPQPQTAPRAEAAPPPAATE